jgi:hypothetical protein
MTIFLRRERINEFHEAETLLTLLLNLCEFWVMKLNVYETIERNFLLIIDVSSMFYFILYDMIILKTSKPRHESSR